MILEPNAIDFRHGRTLLGDRHKRRWQPRWLKRELRSETSWERDLHLSQYGWKAMKLMNCFIKRLNGSGRAAGPILKRAFQCVRFAVESYNENRNVEMATCELERIEACRCNEVWLYWLCLNLYECLFQLSPWSAAELPAWGEKALSYSQNIWHSLAYLRAEDLELLEKRWEEGDANWDRFARGFGIKVRRQPRTTQLNKIVSQRILNENANHIT